MYQFQTGLDPYNLQRQQVIKVNGVNGANAFQMYPNSSVLLLDESAPRLFLAQTDGAGYKTITAYKLEPYIEPETISNADLLERIIKLEEKINGQSNIRHDKQTESNKRDLKESKQNV